MELEEAPIPRERIERRIDEWFDDGPPGASVAIVDGDETVFATGRGHRCLDPERPATPETLYGVGSVTKPVTATAVLALVDRGDLALEDPVDEYVPFLEGVPGDPITVHELLSHTSGMPADDVATVLVFDAVLGEDIGPSIDDWEAFRAYVAGTTDRRRTDDRCRYYNSGYVVLARLIEAVTETSFPEFVAETVFDPLGIDRATFDMSVLGDDARDVMTPYVDDEDGPTAASLPESPAFQAPGGLLASVTDLATFLSTAIEGGPPLDDATRRRSYEPVGTFERLVDGTERGYGYGWITRPFGDDTLVGHSGGTAVSCGYMGFLRDRGLGVVVGCNAQPDSSPAVLARDLLAICTDRDPATVSPGRAIERAVDPLVGRYESYRGIQSATVEWTGDALRIDHRTPMGEETHRLHPTSVGTEVREFASVDGDGERTTAEFSVTDDGPELLMGPQLFRRVGDLPAEEE